MWMLRHAQRYEHIALDDNRLPQDPVIDAAHHDNRPRPTPLWRLWTGRVLVAIIILFAGSLGVAGTHHRLDTWKASDPEAISKPASQPQTATRTCTVRREWRTLDTTEQQAYISAVKCLDQQPSALTTDLRSLYEDFPYIHSHVGYYTHGSAPFLPWHRYFLHIYERTLREKCGYQGGLVYWDWTLDSQALEKSPIFDPQTGFGGDGEAGGNITVGRSGRCVREGPFAGLNVTFYDVKHSPHCLSRGFRDQEGNLGHIDGHDLSPESIEELLKIDKYEDFVEAIESKVHDAIPFGIGGDFETFTAPYDPIFFLHHTQLDRLWWIWQQRDGGVRREQYGGHKHRQSIEKASLADEIHLSKLAPVVKVMELTDTEAIDGLLCYWY